MAKSKKKKKKRKEEVKREELEGNEQEDEDEDYDEGGDDNPMAEPIVELTARDANQIVDELYPQAIQMLVANWMQGSDGGDPQVLKCDLQSASMLIHAYWLKRICAAIMVMPSRLHDAAASSEEEEEDE